MFDGVAFRAGHKHLLVLARESATQQPRIGLIIAKRHVRTAVARNRVKRLVRESFRRRRQQLPALDLVVLGRSGVHRLDNQTLLGILDDVWTRLEKQAHTLDRPQD